MRRTTFLSLLLAGGLLLAAAEAPAAPVFKVVVNSANGASSMTRDDVARLFLKKTTTWPGGAQPVQPVDQSRDSAVRKAFTKAVLGRDVLPGVGRPEAAAAHHANGIHPLLGLVQFGR